MLIATVVNLRDMARIQVARRGEGPRIRRVATCTSNNPPRTANKGLSSGWGGVNNYHHKKTACYEKLHRVSDGFLGSTYAK
jgi:hypothetical protein